MSDGQACEVPLVEQLRSIPEDYRTVRAIQWSDDGRETGHQYIPVGFMMHRAAAEIERLQSDVTRGMANHNADIQPHGPKWIQVSERLPEVGKQVITRHFLDRIDMLTFDGENFQFPLTCPVDENGKPQGFTSCYPLDAITHWIEVPSFATELHLKEQK